MYRSLKYILMFLRKTSFSFHVRHIAKKKFISYFAYEIARYHHYFTVQLLFLKAPMQVNYDPAVTFCEILTTFLYL